MEIIELPLAGAKLIRPRVFRDDRGFFFESYSKERYAAQGITETWVQDNHSQSRQSTLRGLHYQSKPGQAKLVRVEVRGDTIRFNRPEFSLEPGAVETLSVYVPQQSRSHSRPCCRRWSRCRSSPRDTWSVG